MIGASLGGGRVTFPMLENPDFVNKGICALELAADGYHWKIQEPLVIEVALERLRKPSLGCRVPPVFTTCLASLDSLIAMLGPAITTSNILEPMVRQALSYFNGVLVSDLPFLGLDEAILPLWAKQHTLNITDTDKLKFDSYERISPTAIVDCSLQIAPISKAFESTSSIFGESLTFC